MIVEIQQTALVFLSLTGLPLLMCSSDDFIDWFAELIQIVFVISLLVSSITTLIRIWL